MLKRRLDESEKQATEQQLEAAKLRTKLHDSREALRHTAHRIDSLQMDSSQNELRQSSDHMDSLKLLLEKANAESQLEMQKFERIIQTMHDEQTSDLKHQRSFVKSIVQQIS